MNTELIPPEVLKSPSAMAAPTEAQVLLDVAQSYEIDSQQMFESAGEDLRLVVTKRKSIEAARMEITRPLDTAKAAVMSFFRRPVELLEQAERVLKNGMATYESEERTRIDQERRDAEARAAAERAEAAKREQEAQEAARAAMESGDEKAMAEAVDKVEAARADIDIASMAPSMPVQLVPKASGVGFRSKWKARVTNLDALIAAAAEKPEWRHLLAVDTTALNATATATKGAVKIPGIEFYEESIVSARRAG